jgi:hypothetical protein
MHMRSRVPLLKAVSLHTVFAKFRVTQLQLFIAQIRDLVAPIAVRRTAGDNTHCRKLDTTPGLGADGESHSSLDF